MSSVNIEGYINGIMMPLLLQELFVIIDQSQLLLNSGSSISINVKVLVNVQVGSF